ncbi:MAG: flagellar basal body P-ring formation protein FlgA [Gammaproteobacteria bacterium]|nr:MAG: flagellar basal body P-ring formation protein FlgA [Gammaproteobacteria bacterium]
MQKHLIFLHIFILLSSVSNVHAGIQSHESLKNTVASFLQSETKDTKDSEITVQDFDRRLRLHQCSTPLQAFWPLGNKRFGNTTVGVRCTGDKPWKVYVGAHIHIYKSVWVSNIGLNRNQVLDLASISKEKRDITRLTGGYLLSDTPIQGMQIKRNIPANQVLTNTMLDSQKMIKRGERITIVSRAGGIEVRATGVALSDGSKGERIRVKNTSSKREIEAYVSGKHLVLVTL